MTVIDPSGEHSVYGSLGIDSTSDGVVNGWLERKTLGFNLSTYVFKIRSIFLPIEQNRFVLLGRDIRPNGANRLVHHV